MDQEARGNITLNLNYKRNANSKAPAITGRISTPEDPETEFSFSAFEHTDKNGEAYWIGPVDMNRSMRHALNNESPRGHNFVTVRLNAFKVFKDNIDGTPNAAYAKLSADEKKAEDLKPAFWGSFTRNPDTDPVLKLAAWERDPSRYGPWASGNTAHPLTKEESAALKAGHAPNPGELALPEPSQQSRRRREKDVVGRAG